MGGRKYPIYISIKSSDLGRGATRELKEVLPRD
jgi:hypothetical protein